jgi:hypothetical protein
MHGLIKTFSLVSLASVALAAPILVRCLAHPRCSLAHVRTGGSHEQQGAYGHRRRQQPEGGLSLLALMAAKVEQNGNGHGGLLGLGVNALSGSIARPSMSLTMIVR